MMRPPQGLLWETSLLDADEGIRFRGYSIPELQVCNGWAALSSQVAVGHDRAYGCSTAPMCRPPALMLVQHVPQNTAAPSAAVLYLILSVSFSPCLSLLFDGSRFAPG